MAAQDITATLPIRPRMITTTISSTSVKARRAWGACGITVRSRGVFTRSRSGGPPRPLAEARLDARLDAGRSDLAVLDLDVVDVRVVAFAAGNAVLAVGDHAELRRAADRRLEDVLVAPGVLGHDVGV